MIQGTQWPSFIIQGIVLGVNLWFLVENGSDSNLWIFFSFLAVLSTFSLQTTSVGFLYLYPVQTDSSGKVIRKTVGIDTWILRLLIMACLFCLYMGILSEYPFWNRWWLVFPGLALILLIPIIFNMGIADWMRDRATK